MSAFSAINLATLPAPTIIERLTYEEILASIKADLIARLPDMEAVLELESEPLVKILEVWAYRESLLRAAVDDAGRGNMLAYALGEDLDQLAALFGVERLVVQEPDYDQVPPVEEILESDDRLRARVQLALEGYSTAGPVGAYMFHALSASTDVRDVSVTSSVPGQVDVTILSDTGDGTADTALLDIVEAALNDEDVRPLCDTVVVQAAVIVNYTVEADLTLYEGPDSSVVLATAQAAIEAFVAEHHRIGHDINLSGIYAALHQAGVQNVSLTAPVADLAVDDDTAAYCTSIDLAVVGTDV